MFCAASTSSIAWRSLASMRTWAWGFVAALGIAVLVLLTPDDAFADQAPFWESPVGLIPGNPTSQVRMAAENVDVQVIERGDAVLALVTASFDMINDGQDQILRVGFPASTVSLFDDLVSPDATGRHFADAPVTFPPESLRAFRVSVGGRELRSWRQDVPAAAQAGFGADWLMWEMAYPAGQPVRVEVSYEQVLSDRTRETVVKPMYVLRTGALWPGPIGDAIVTFTAPDGGAFVGGAALFSREEPGGSVAVYPRADQVYDPAVAAESSPTRIVWHFRDFEPTGDVGAAYVRAEAWKRFADADAAVEATASPSAGQLREAVDAALAILSGAIACGLPAGDTCIDGPYGVPRGLVDRLSGSLRDRASWAVELAPNDASVQQIYGDAELWLAMPRHKHHGELACWPSSAVNAYERTIMLGVDGASSRLDRLEQSARAVRFFPDGRLETCSGQVDQRLDVEMVKATIEQGNAVWASAVGRGGDAGSYPAYFADAWLTERQAEVADLRATGRYREARLIDMDVTTARITGLDTATAETIERWEDRTYSADRSLLHDASGTLHQRYELRRVEGQWKIVAATIVRARLPGQFGASPLIQA